MSLTTRILDRADWHGVLTLTALGPVSEQMPDDTRVIVVEDDGVLVGCWALTRMWQAEGLWMAPEAAKSSSVGRRLLLAMREQAKAVGTHVLLTGADTPEVEAMLTKVGASRIPVTLYRWPMEGT